jgi:hypothetical protein
MKGHKVALGGSYSGDSAALFRGLTDEGILQFSLVGREVTLQVMSENLEQVLKSLGGHGVQNVSILEWRKCGTTLAGSGCASDSGQVLKVSLIPSTLGGGMRPLSVAHQVPLDRKLYIEMLANLEVVLIDAGVSDVLYALQVGKSAPREKCVEAVKEAALQALFNSGGVVGIE